MTQMPAYAKIFKEILSNRRKLEEEQIVTLTKKVSAIVMNKLSPKLRDSGSFTVLCAIGNMKFNQALCDLGASVILMPKSVFDRIGIRELIQTKITLQLADRSTRLLLGMIEDLPFQIGKFYIPIDFIIIEMDENLETPLILGRPFLVTVGTKIYVRGGRLTFEVGNEVMIFDVLRVLKYPSNESNICRINRDGRQRA
jgi:Aspartyl protease